MNTSDLIAPRHLSRRAMIYVRQSTQQQVLSHQESQRLQRALRDRALQLGWHERDIEIIDVDLGQSASTSECRIGYQHLVSEVALGHVGVVIAYDAARLARNCSVWYQLLDLCSRADCLIADRDGVYDPSSINGRLLLGLKGQISELELHTIRSRLLAGKLSKAARGELGLHLPIGFVKLDDGRVVKHPDREVQDRISLIFTLLLEKKSLGQLVRYLNREGLKVPRRDPNRPGGVRWKRADVPSVGSMVANPAYAGAYVFGRKRRNIEGKPAKKAVRIPRSQWQVCLRDKYPAYISWDVFERIESMLRDNYAEYDRNKTRGVPRDGKTLLQGIVYCGECGHKMGVQYKRSIRYMCNRLRQISPGDPVCQWLTSDPIDDQVVQWFFEALSGARIDACQQALEEADRERDLILASRRQQLARLRYQTQLAERQYQQADPDNRLVAAELEQRWEFALRELKAEEERQAADEERTPFWAIPADLLTALKDVGPRLPEMWRQGLFTTAQKKGLLRSVIDKVVLHRVGGSRGDRIHVRVVWRGGATTSGDVSVKVGNFSQLPRAKEMEEAIVQLSREGYFAAEIAHRLTADGFRSPWSDHVLPSTVRTVCYRHGIFNKARSRPVHVPGYLTISELAKKLGIRRDWFLEEIGRGTIRIEKTPSTRCYLFPDRPETLNEIRLLRERKIKQLVY
jgi:DNA invertase Pin-like site-specific DNA recombinase